jgi:hypothetical protein
MMAGYWKRSMLLSMLLLTILVAGIIANNAAVISAMPVQDNPYTGTFTDDYGIKYTINDTLWIQHPRTKYHIVKWNKQAQYLIARNDAKNPGEPRLYTRIDLMKFDGMAPWLWGYCLTVYNATSDSAAESVAITDRKNPRKGCNGYPFSRMKSE